MNIELSIKVLFVINGADNAAVYRTGYSRNRTLRWWLHRTAKVTRDHNSLVQNYKYHNGTFREVACMRHFRETPYAAANGILRYASFDELHYPISLYRYSGLTQTNEQIVLYHYCEKHKRGNRKYYNSVLIVELREIFCAYSQNIDEK